MHLSDVEGVDENVFDEVAGVHVAKRVGEGKDERGVDAGGGEEFELAGERGDERLRLFGAEDAGRMGVEGDGEGFSAQETGSGEDFGDD